VFLFAKNSTGEKSMGVHISGRYLGNKKMELTHGPSGARIVTAAPVDNQGDGSSFSPTDLVAGALGACLMTIMSIYAERHEIDLSGAWFETEKNMSKEAPRRITALPVRVHLPSRLTQAQREALEHASHGCPVHHSLSSEVQAPVSFFYDVE
jgi:putative redox protein